MNNIDDLYKLLLEKERETVKKLEWLEKELGSEPFVQKSIVVKNIKGKKYYYNQWKEQGKLRTQYLCPVTPGAIAEQELLMKKHQKLLEEQKEQLRVQKYLRQTLKSMEKDRRTEKIVEDYSFEVFWKDELTARVTVQGKYVKVSRFSDHPLKQLFAERNMTRYQLNCILELRCWDRQRADINEILKRLGLNEYNPYEIVRKTHGVSYNDYIWFRFPGEKITSKDVLVR